MKESTKELFKAWSYAIGAVILIYKAMENAFNSGRDHSVEQIIDYANNNPGETFKEFIKK